jgi:hypothetical protein
VRSATDRLRTAAIAVAAVRIGAGVALAGTPTTWLRWEAATTPGSAMPLLLRTVGIRDLALGLGTAAALIGGPPDGARAWLAAGLLSDTLDVAAGVASARTTGLRGGSSALMALPVALLGAWGLATAHLPRH